MLPLLGGCRKSVQHGNAAPKQVTAAAFDADSAYSFVVKQVGYGPRVPQYKAHDECAHYLVRKLSAYADTVILQRGTMRRYDGRTLPILNIIASFNPESPRRVMLSAHYDTRPWADQDKNEAAWKKPFDGANDGASGVAVLLEIARQLKAEPLDYGIDIILWDAEDSGTPQFEQQRAANNSWCLGSQYWVKNKHRHGYQAQYGILLDMVGAPDAKFYMEQYSTQNAASLVNDVWNTAHRLGFGEWFVKKNVYPVTDDHYYLNLAGIPTIDIIHYDDLNGFGAYWHTTGDNLDAVSAKTLNAVGTTVLSFLRNM